MLTAIPKALFLGNVVLVLVVPDHSSRNVSLSGYARKSNDSVHVAELTRDLSYLPRTCINAHAELQSRLRAIVS